MCCFKRLAVKIKRKACWRRGERTPSVTRPSQNEINRKKANAQRNDERNIRRRELSVAQEETERRTEFFQQKGWLRAEEVL